MMPLPVLIVDDDPQTLMLVQAQLSSAGIESSGSSDAQGALDSMAAHEPHVVVLDLSPAAASGNKLLSDIRSHSPRVDVIVIVGDPGVDEAVACMQLGAVDVVSRPFDPIRLVTAVRNTLQRRRVHDRVDRLADELRHVDSARMIGDSACMQEALAMLSRAASSDVTVLLQGESGTGKELAARAIHAGSTRRHAPFIPVNCGAIPEALIESEFFGHEKGSFTGADETRDGLFVHASGGSVLLDEVGELRIDLQVKLLRVLQERCVRRIGSDRSIPVDVRVIAASNRDLMKLTEVNGFRRDLYYRLAVFPVNLPPLRDRGADVEILARMFVQQFASLHSRPARDLSQDALNALRQHSWPGNVRELENLMERAVIIEQSDEVGRSSLPPYVFGPAEASSGGSSDAGHSGARPDGPASLLPLAEEERRIILNALEVCGWRVQTAARRLGIGRATIYRKIEKLGLRHRLTSTDS